jgi:DNA modification methylase
MSASGYKDEEVEEVYEQLEEKMENVKKNDNLIILGEWNAVVGEGQKGTQSQKGDAVGKNGLGFINNRGKRLIDCIKEKEFVITNTIFRQYPRRRYTWVKPGGTA